MKTITTLPLRMDSTKVYLAKNINDTARAYLTYDSDFGYSAKIHTDYRHQFNSSFINSEGVILSSSKYIMTKRLKSLGFKIEKK